MQLENKKIILTGGTKGIGAATVKTYVKEGANVVFCGTNDERGLAVEKAANEIGPGKATYFRCDISKKDEVDAFFAKAEEILGGLDCLANVAGVEGNCAASEWDDEKIDWLMNINVKGTIWTNQAAYRLFKKYGTVDGSIINYSSDTAIVGMPNGAVYAASKSAVLGWVRSIAFEWGMELNIRTNCVHPTIKTPMYEAWLKSADPAIVEMHKKGLKMKYPIDGGMGDAEKDCAPVMVFLASDASRYVNGQIICVNGGAYTVR